MLMIIIWIVFSMIVALIAAFQKNRNSYGWFLISLLTSPIIALLMLSCCEKRTFDVNDTFIQDFILDFIDEYGLNGHKEIKYKKASEKLAYKAMRAKESINCDDIEKMKHIMIYWNRIS